MLSCDHHTVKHTSFYQIQGLEDCQPYISDSINRIFLLRCMEVV